MNDEIMQLKQGLMDHLIKEIDDYLFENYKSDADEDVSGIEEVEAMPMEEAPKEISDMLSGVMDEDQGSDEMAMEGEEGLEVMEGDVDEENEEDAYVKSKMKNNFSGFSKGKY